MPEPVAEPLHRGAGHEDGALEGVGAGAVRERPADGREQPLDGLRAGVAHVHQHEAARAVGVLRHARLQAGLAEQGRLLVAGDARHGKAGREAVARRPSRRTGRSRAAPRAARRGARRRGRAARPTRPASGCRRASCGWRWTARSACTPPVGAAREVPEQPAVDGAERQVRRRLDTPFVEQPLHLGGGEVGIEHQPGRGPHERLVPRGAQLVAARRGATVLPHDGAVEGPAGAPVPGHDRLALVGDPDRCDGFGELADQLGHRGSARPPRSRRRRAPPSPGRGKCWVNSRYANPAAVPSSRSAAALTPVVPASMASTTDIGRGGYRYRRRAEDDDDGSGGADACRDADRRR